MRPAVLLVWSMGARKGPEGAYCEGLGLCAVAVQGAGGRLVVSAEWEAGQAVERLWFFRREVAELVVRIARLERCSPAAEPPLDIVESAAARIGAVWKTDAEVVLAAAQVEARVNHEIASMQVTGALRDINRRYRQYRLAATAAGNMALRYADWLYEFRLSMMREVANTLRYY